MFKIVCCSSYISGPYFISMFWAKITIGQLIAANAVFRNQWLMYFTDRWSHHLRESKKKGSCRAIPVAQNCHENPSSSAENVRNLKNSPKRNKSPMIASKGASSSNQQIFQGIFVSFRGDFHLVNTGSQTTWSILKGEKNKLFQMTDRSHPTEDKATGSRKKSHVQLAAHRHRKSVNVESWIHWFTSRWFNELAPIKTLFSCSILGITSCPVIYIGDYMKLLYGSLLTKKLDWNLPSLHFTNAPNVWNSY